MKELNKNKSSKQSWFALPPASIQPGFVLSWRLSSGCLTPTELPRRSCAEGITPNPAMKAHLGALFQSKLLCWYEKSISVSSFLQLQGSERCCSAAGSQTGTREADDLTSTVDLSKEFQAASPSCLCRWQSNIWHSGLLPCCWQCVSASRVTAARTHLYPLRWDCRFCAANLPKARLQWG